MSFIFQAIGLGLSLLSTVQNVKAEQVSFDATREAGKFRAQVLRQNKVIAEERGKDALQRGIFEQLVQKSSTDQLIGQSRANAAARGVEIGEGSAGDIEANLRGIGNIELSIIKDNASREDLALRQQGEQFEIQAQLEEIGIDSARVARDIGISSALIGGASSVSSKWFSFNREGGFGTTASNSASAFSPRRTETTSKPGGLGGV